MSKGNLDPSLSNSNEEKVVLDDSLTTKIARESPLRSFLKGLSWRFLATGLLILIVYLVEGTLDTALKIGAGEFVAKLLIYFGHERAWSMFLNGKEQTRKISLLKTVSWRIIASLTTLTIVMSALSNGGSAITIVIVEFFTKFVAYYIHERTWQVLPRGTFRRIFKKNN